jgi:hypothetical protein
MREEVMSDLTSLLSFIDKTGRGVSVQASTLGSLEALLDFLKVSKIPVSGINIGPVHRKDIMRCAVMLDRARELAVMLCFDVPVDKDAERMADELGIKVFKGNMLLSFFNVSHTNKCFKPTSSTICLMRSPLIMQRLRRRSVKTLLRRPSGHVGSRSLHASPSEIQSFSAWTFWMGLSV